MLIRRLLFITIIISFVPFFLISQELNEVSIFGYVKDGSTGKPISGVIVECINENDTTQKYSDVSNATGRYIIDIVTGVESVSEENILPQNYRLEQNYPNPFNPTTNIHFNIPQSGQVNLDIYNQLGQKVKTLVNNVYDRSAYSVVWDAMDETGKKVPAGLYFYRLRSEEFIETKKMILLDSEVNFQNFNSNSFSSEESNKKYILEKPNNLTVTIRAKSDRILDFEQKNILISSKYLRYDINTTLLQTSVFNGDKIVISGPDPTDKVFVSGLAKAVIDTILGTEKVLVENERTHEKSSMRIEYDGGFRTMMFLGESGDLFSFTLLKDGKQVGDTLQQILKQLKPPKVRDTSPTNGERDVVVDVKCIVNFVQPMDTTTITNESFFLLNGGPVGGNINFLNENMTAVFSPLEPLRSQATYTIKLTNNIKDIWGMTFEDDTVRSFTTISGTLETKIIFSAVTSEPTYPEINSSLYSVNSDGSDWQQITKLNYAKDLDSDYSLDGKKITFVRQINQPVPGMFFDIYLINRDGTFPENLTNTPDYDEDHPSFSPDGNKIAFSAISNKTDDNYEIYVMDINGENRLNITNHPGNDYTPDWSPEGKYIVFSSDRDSIMQDLFVMNSDGSNPKNLTETIDNLCQHPVWSPDGTKIAFFRSIWQQGWYDDFLYIMDPDGNNMTEVIPGPFQTFSGIAWSPNSNRLAFIEINWDLGLAISIINIDGTNKHQITNWDPYVTWYESPAWSPR